MAVDYAEKEREFLESLAGDTGRDLAGWMAAIAATSLTDRNAIIDWLRQQGFLFAKASWMERIYHNGGRPIYFDPAAFVVTGAVKVTGTPTPSIPPAPPPASTAPTLAPAVTAPPIKQSIMPEPFTPAPLIPAATGGAALDSLLAEAKGYRPLAQLLLREIEKAVPGAVLEARSGYIAIRCKGALAGVLTVSPKDLRLALSWPPDKLAPAGFSRAKFTKPSPDIPTEISHMIVLSDARQVTPDLLATVVEAARRA